MAAIQGKAVLFGTSAVGGTPGAFVLTQADGTTLTGYVSPIISGLNPSHQSATDKILDESGEFVAVVTHGEFLEATFECIPAGAAATDAAISATLPQPNSAVAITGMDVIAIGHFTDALNVTTGTPGGNKWLYEGGGSLNLRADGHGTMSLPLRRYLKIAPATAIPA